MNEEIEIECFNGKHKIISNTAIPLIDESKKIYGAVVVVQDITERTRSAEELQRRNDYLAAVQETTIELISQLDLDKLLENITIRAGQLMGTPACYIDLIDPETGIMVPKVGKGISEDSMLHPVRKGEGVAGVVWETAKPLIINDYDHWSGKLNGYVEKEVYSVVGVPLLIGDEAFGVLELAHEFSSKKEFEPEAVEFLSQFARLATIAIQNAQLYTQVKQELAERRAAEDALIESEQRFHQMFAEHNAIMLLIDPLTGKIMDANAAASRFYGYSLEQLHCMLIGDLNLLPKEKVNQAMKSILDEGPDVLIFPHRLATGEVRSVEVHSSPIKVNNKKILFSIIHDITDRQQAETQIQQQLEELRRWNSVTLGRETRVMELKHEVNELLKKLGSASRYSFTQEPDDE
jgi:PAS domain S-box-containing protein